MLRRCITADILRHIYYARYHGRYVTEDISRQIYYGIYIYIYMTRDISWQIHEGNYITADMLRQIYYGRHITADIVLLIHYGRYIAHKENAISRHIYSIRSRRLLLSNLLVTTDQPSEPRDLPDNPEDPHMMRPGNIPGNFFMCSKETLQNLEGGPFHVRRGVCS